MEAVKKDSGQEWWAELRQWLDTLWKVIGDSGHPLPAYPEARAREREAWMLYSGHGLNGNPHMKMSILLVNVKWMATTTWAMVQPLTAFRIRALSGKHGLNEIPYERGIYVLVYA